METARPAQYSNVGGGFVRAVTTLSRMVRLRRRARKGSGAAVGMVSEDGGGGGGGGGGEKDMFPERFDDVSLPSLPDFSEEDDKKRRQQQLHDKEAMEALLARMFASISAVKAAYAQLQTAQSPYDPVTVQSADQVVVSELKQLSQMKQSYCRKQIHGSGGGGARESLIRAELQEHRNLIKAFQITGKKMEGELQNKEAEILVLQEQLAESEKLNKIMEDQVHPDDRATLRMLDHLPLSDLNVTHFLCFFRYTVKSIRAFAKVMAAAMERAGWDLAAAAAASIERGVSCPRPEHRVFAFESYVCRTMFSDFQHHLFGLGDQSSAGSTSSLVDRRRFFDEFVDLKTGKLNQLLSGAHDSARSAFPEFCRGKYLKLVHPTMEESFFGNLDQRALLRTAAGFPETGFFLGFAEMARRVWLLHRLFFSFDADEQATVFEARRGCRFSEVYMESVAEPEVPEGSAPVVGFTVVPGFKVGKKTVVPCKVYVTAAGARR